MSSTILKKYDELIRCADVLTDGAENEFHKFVAHQEKCRKRWHVAEEENHETKKCMAKYKADHDTLEVRLKMARNQLDAEMRKRLRAEQAADQLSRQFDLIKELLLDKDADKQFLIQSIYQNERTEPADEAENTQYTVDSSIDLPESEYDVTEDDILDDTGDILGDGRKSKRGSLANRLSKEPNEEVTGKKTRFSGDVDSYYV